MSCNRDDKLELCVIAIKLPLCFYQSNVSWEISAALAQSQFPKVASDYNQTCSDVHAYKMFYSHNTVIYFVLITCIETHSRKQRECET